VDSAQNGSVLPEPNRFRGKRLFALVTVMELSSARRIDCVVGRDEQFRAFYTQEYSGLAGYVWTLVRDRELAHDLTQEAFTRMLGRLSKVDDPKAYVYGVATNLVRRAWRSRADQIAAVGALAGQPVRPMPEITGMVEVRSAVEALPRRLRDVVLLHYWADLTVTDVAAAVGRPPGTVKRQLSEARTLLAEMVTRG
jgi:RNA polymerase sigma factor (sigma-70 family)